MPFKRDQWSKPFLVVDLDPAAVRVLEVCPSTQGYLFKWGATKLDRSNGKSYRLSASEALRKLLTHHGIATRDARLLLSGPTTITLPLDLPPLPPKEIPKAVQWSLPRVMPFPLTEAILDHKSLGSKPGDQEQTVLVAAVKRSALDESVDIVQKAGLSPVQVSLLPLALNGLMQALPVKSKETTLLIDLRPNLATLMFFHGRTLHLVRTLSAEARATAKGDGGAKGPLSRLVDEIWLSLAYYQEQFSGERIQRLWVAGSSHDLEEVQPALSEAVGIPVEPVNLSTVLPVGRDEPVPPALAAAAGILFDHSNLNLLPREIRYSKQRKILRTAVRGTVVALFLGVFTWTGMEVVAVRQQRQEIAEQKAALERMSSVSKELRMFEQVGANLNPHLHVYEEPLAFNLRWLGALKTLSAVTPPNISFTSLEADGTQGIKLKGLAFADADPPEVSLSEFMTRLSESPYFGVITLGSSQEQSGYPQRTVAFDLVVAWR